MPRTSRAFFPVRTTTFVPDPAGPGQIEAMWHQGWSQPYFPRIKPRLRTALTASGPFYLQAGTQNAPFGRGEVNFAEESLESKYHYPWSTPKRFKRGLGVHLQWTFAVDVVPFPLTKGAGWYSPFSEPVRVKLGLRAGLQQFTLIDTNLVPVLNTGYFSQYSEPVRQKQGLRTELQQFLAYHPRILPNPNVTVTWTSIETIPDVALIAVNVYDAASTVTIGQGARVSVIEVTASGHPVATGNDPVSIREV